MLPTAQFHHRYLRSVDPSAAIGFYTQRFAATPSASRADVPALHSPNEVMIVVDKLDELSTSALQSGMPDFS
jgi:hypothetical protein